MTRRRFVPGQTHGSWIALAAALALTTGTAIGWALLRPRAVISTVPLPPVTLTPSPPVIGALLPAQSRPGLVLVPPTIPARVAQTAPGTRSTPPTTQSTAPVTPPGTRKSTPGGARSTPTSPVPGPVSVPSQVKTTPPATRPAPSQATFTTPPASRPAPETSPAAPASTPPATPHGTRFRATSHPPRDHPGHHASIRSGQPRTRADMTSSDAVGAVWLLLTAIFWSTAGWAAANGMTGPAFAYSVCPFALMPVTGFVMQDLDRRRNRRP